MYIILFFSQLATVEEEEEGENVEENEVSQKTDDAEAEKVASSIVSDFVKNVVEIQGLYLSVLYNVIKNVVDIQGLYLPVLYLMSSKML